MKAAQKVIDDANALLFIPEFESVCCKCGKEKPALVGVKADAKSYCKNATKEMIYAAVALFYKKAQERFQATTVTQLRRYKHRGFVGGRLESLNRDRIVLSFQDLEAILRFTLDDSNFAVVAGHVI